MALLLKNISKQHFTTVDSEYTREVLKNFVKVLSTIHFYDVFEKIMKVPKIRMKKAKVFSTFINVIG